MELEGLTYRFLQEEEFSREDIRKIFEENNSKAPIFGVANILIAEDENKKLVGFSTMQPCFHNEPSWIHPDYRKTLLVLKLNRKLLEAYKEIKGLQVFTFSPNSKIASLLKRLGCKELPYKVFVKEIS